MTSVSERPTITAAHKWLISGVVTGAVTIAAISFAGSYRAVRDLAARQGFGAFAPYFPIGLDAGIAVLLALDFLLTWLRIPVGGLRPMAWLLTAATIAFNAAAAWPDPLGTSMHAVTPLLFVITVEAARSAMCRLANIIEGRGRIERIPFTRWVLAPRQSFGLFRRMHLWRIKTLDEAVALDQKSRMFAAEMRQSFGRRWRTSGPARAAMAHRFATEFGAALDVEATEFLTPPRGAAPDLAPAKRPAPKPRPERPEGEGAPKGQGAEGAPKGETPRRRPEPAKRPAPAPAPQGDGAKAPSRTDVKKKITDLYDELGRRPGEGQIVKILEAEAQRGYPYKSRRHAQQLRDEIEHGRPDLAARGSDNVRPISTGTDG